MADSELAHVCTPSGLIQRIRPTMSTIKPTTPENQAVALLDNPGVALAVCLLGRILISVISLISGSQPK